MLHKPFDTPEPPVSNPAARAGWQAEKELAFFLDRAFKADPAVHLFHSLRFKLPDAHAAAEDDFAQIDHLILHRHGIIIVESKSLAGEVQINEHGEFTRIHSRGREGIRSPVQQAVRQGEALRALLIPHSTALRDRKFLGLVQAGFQHCPIDALIAISPNSIITGKGRSALPEVHKADAIPGAVRKLMEQRRKDYSSNEDVPACLFAEAELERIAAFLLQRDQPIAAPTRRPEPKAVPPAPPPAPRPPKAPIPAPTPSTPPATPLEPLTCRHCRSINVFALFKKDYCLECSECGKFTSLDRNCPACGKRANIHKKGAEFRRECPCGHAAVFWRNP